MKTLREFIGKDPLGAADAESKRSEGSAFFGNYLPSSIDPLWLRVLSKFTNDIPLKYWDKEIIEKALTALGSLIFMVELRNPPAWCKC